MAIAQETRRIQPNLMPMVALVIGSWVIMVLLMTGPHHRLLAHDAILAGRSWPDPATLLLFLAAWQVMTGAMMLPSSLPMVRLFVGASRRQSRPGAALALFVGAYFAVWTGFALLALLADAGLHVTVARWHSLADRPELITGGVLILAGAFQFSSLKERCLDACRSPLGFLYQHYRRGLRSAWALGLRHGLFCLGCCWALMLVMFAVGIGSLAGMAGLTGVMVIEKAFPWGRRLAPIVGLSLMAWGSWLIFAPMALGAVA